MHTLPIQTPFLPSLGMVWRGMWGLAVIPIVPVAVVPDGSAVSAEAGKDEPPKAA